MFYCFFLDILSLKLFNIATLRTTLVACGCQLGLAHLWEGSILALQALRMRRLLIPGILIALTATGARQATALVLYSGTNIDLVASNPILVGKTLEAFTLTAVGLNGAIPNTFDSTNSGQGGTGITTVGTNLAQAWEFGGVVPTPTQNLVVPGDIPQAIDTHFLVDSTAIFSVVAPQENFLVPNPTEAPSAGLGNALWGLSRSPARPPQIGLLLTLSYRPT